MRFRPVKRFIGNTLESIASWLSDELNSAQRELYIGLSELSFRDNFRSFQWQGTIAAGGEVQIPNPLSRVPSGRIVFRQTGNAVIEDGGVWSVEAVALRNRGANPVTATVIFFG